MHLTISEKGSKISYLYNDFITNTQMINIKLLGRFGLGLHADTERLVECVEKMMAAEYGEVINLDFSEVEFFYPSGINALAIIGLYLMNAKKCYIKQNYPSSVETKNFLIESGFCDLVGVNPKVDPRVPPHNGGYIYKIRKFISVDDDAISEMIDVIEKELQLSGNVRGNVHGNLAELILNVQQHSQSLLNCFLVGQGYATTHRVRFCIADVGMGIKAHLGNKFKDLLLKNSIAAIEKALIEGVTGTTNSENAGVGLSYFKQFVDVCNGSFSIISGDGFYAEERDDKGRKAIKKIALNFNFPGTLIDFVICSRPGLKLFTMKEPIPKEYRLIR